MVKVKEAARIGQLDRGGTIGFSYVCGCTF